MNKKEAEKQLKEVQKEITRLQKKADKLSCMIREMETMEITTQFVNSITTVSDKNSMHVRLERNSKTTPIMDSFWKSDKTFLVFDRLFWVVVFPQGILWRISLVIRKGWAPISIIDDGLTMSDLKMHAGLGIEPNQYWESGRVCSLAKEVLNAGPKMKEPNQAIAFDLPIRLRGQTYANQTGFGSEYNGDELVYQGTLYGETTDFYIIGLIVNNGGSSYISGD